MNVQQPGKPGREKEEKIADTQNGGTVGLLVLTVVMTAIVYLVVESLHSGTWAVMRMPQFPRDLHSYVDAKVMVAVLGWFLLQFVLYWLPIGGREGEGAPLKGDGRRMKYRLNAFFVFLVNVFGFVLAYFINPSVIVISSKLFQILTSCLIFVFTLSTILYVKSKWTPESQLNPAGNTGSIVYDWFMGRELNPRFGTVDVKIVMFRSGVTGWIILNVVNLIKASETATPSPSLLLTFGMQFLYVADLFWFEDTMLTSREVVYEGGGYNVFSMASMFPFLYTVQTRYLCSTHISMPWYCLLGIALLWVLGYYIYRGSNLEKTKFRKNPNDPSLSHLETIPTATGKSLLVSGWWGLCRHPNYLGDIIIAFSFSLPTGFSHVGTYIYPFVLLLLLIDREQRDGAECKERYGAVWDLYCQRVPYRIIPKIF